MFRTRFACAFLRRREGGATRNSCKFVRFVVKIIYDNSWSIYGNSC